MDKPHYTLPTSASTPTPSALLQKRLQVEVSKLESITTRLTQLKRGGGGAVDDEEGEGAKSGDSSMSEAARRGAISTLQAEMSRQVLAVDTLVKEIQQQSLASKRAPMMGKEKSRVLMPRPTASPVRRQASPRGVALAAATTSASPSLPSGQPIASSIYSGAKSPARALHSRAAASAVVNGGRGGPSPPPLAGTAARRQASAGRASSPSTPPVIASAGTMRFGRKGACDGGVPRYALLNPPMPSPSSFSPSSPPRGAQPSSADRVGTSTRAKSEGEECRSTPPPQPALLTAASMNVSIHGQSTPSHTAATAAAAAAAETPFRVFTVNCSDVLSHEQSEDHANALLRAEALLPAEGADGEGKGEVVSSQVFNASAASAHTTQRDAANGSEKEETTDNGIVDRLQTRLTQFERGTAARLHEDAAAYLAELTEMVSALEGRDRDASEVDSHLYVAARELAAQEMQRMNAILKGTQYALE